MIAPAPPQIIWRMRTTQIDDVAVPLLFYCTLCESETYNEKIQTKTLHRTIRTVSIYASKVRYGWAVGERAHCTMLDTSTIATTIYISKVLIELKRTQENERRHHSRRKSAKPNINLIYGSSPISCVRCLLMMSQAYNPYSAAGGRGSKSSNEASSSTLLRTCFAEEDAPCVAGMPETAKLQLFIACRSRTDL